MKLNILAAVLISLGTMATNSIAAGSDFIIKGPGEALSEEEKSFSIGRSQSGFDDSQAITTSIGQVVGSGKRPCAMEYIDECP